MTGESKGTLLTGHANEAGFSSLVPIVRFSPDGRTLASGGQDKTIRLWDVMTNEHKRTLIGHTGSVSSCSV